MTQLVEQPDGTFRASSDSHPGEFYLVRDVDTLYPKCSCPAGSHGVDCKHVLAVLELIRSRQEENVTQETQTRAVAKRELSVGVRAAGVRDALAAARGGMEDAVNIALMTRHMWPDQLSKLAETDPDEAAKQAGIVVYTAVELGIQPIAAFSYLVPIRGKPFLMARLVQALVGSRVPGGYISIVKTTPKECTVRAHRPGRPDLELTITLEQAVKNGWTKNGNFDKPHWKNDPAMMLRNRGITTVGWLHFADILTGMGGVYDETEGDQYDPGVEAGKLPSYAVVEGQFAEVETQDVKWTATGGELENARVAHVHVEEVDDHTVAPDGTPVGFATPLDPDEDEDLPEDPPEDPPAVDPSYEELFEAEVATMRELALTYSRTVNWKTIQNLFGFEGGTQQAIQAALELWNADRQLDGKEAAEALDIFRTKLEGYLR